MAAARDEGAPLLQPPGIAVIGMSCRFPGAATLEAFWENLRGGVESLVELSDEELLAAGVPPELVRDPSYVRRASVVGGIEEFDAAFFGYTPTEAAIMDPQHRVFLECAWEVLEQGGYDPGRFERPIGVFTGAKTNTYLFNVVAQRHRFPGLDDFQIALGNDLAAMATRVSYKLDLRGPSYALHTACSTSLVAVHLACQSLLLDECAMAIAGGAAINVPQTKGYAYQKGGILSPDGRCRTFDAAAAGSNFGNGAGAVLLKRLEDAVADGDHVFAVIRGSATNNDGARKASFTAPGVEGQIAVLLEAMAVAGVEAEDLSYVEAHGTATDLGDSIEMLALTEAFRASTEKRGFCAIGSAKTNFGHLETAAGIAGLIKTALALERRELPPSLHFERPNPKIDFEASPFEVVTGLRPWPEPPAGRRRIAGVSSFGIGSTNAHVVLEEPPPAPEADPDRPWQLLPLSARTETARGRLSESLGRHLAAHEDLALADAAYTLAVGRKPFDHRRVVVARDRDEAAAALAGERPAAVRDAVLETAGRSAVFLFPGLGEHYAEMGLGLYRREPVFREALDEVAAALRPHLEADLLEVLFPRGADAEERASGGRAEPDLRALLGRGPAADPEGGLLDRTRFAQPAVFAVEVALARLLASRGVVPRAMIGYSVGEYVCAHLAGVLSLADACRLVAGRATLIDSLPPGAMAAAALSEERLAPRLEGRELWLAGVNGAAGCVVAGAPAQVEELRRELESEGVSSRSLATGHAFHSPWMEPVADEVVRLSEGLDLGAPEIPYASNVTGTWITPEDARDPAYWARHLTSPVRFADGLDAVLAEGERALVEVGPGQSLSSFARLHPACGKGRPVVWTLRARHGTACDAAAFLGALGELWLAGVEIDWAAHHRAERRRRVPLPTYPFERRRHWIDPDLETLARAAGRETPARSPAAPDPEAAAVKIADPERWLYRRVWRRAEPQAARMDAEGVWLLLAGAEETGGALPWTHLAERLRTAGAEVVLALPGGAFERADGGAEGAAYRLRPGSAEDFEALLAELAGRPLRRVLHLWNAAPVPEEPAGEAAFRAAQEVGFYSLVALAQALTGTGSMPEGGLEIDVVTHGLFDVVPGDPLSPERSTLLGPAVVIPQEHPNLRVRTLDVDRPGDPAAADTLVRELLGGSDEPVVALRGEERRVRAFERMVLPAPEDAHPFREEGVYLITGGLGGIGLVLARHLATAVRARLILTRRTPLPPREEWDAWLAEHGPGGAPGADRTSRAIEGIRTLEAAGAQVMAAAADVADESAMRALVEEAVARFGALHGVIHTAGVLAPESFKTVQTTGREECELHFGPKAYGLYVLERVLEGVELDFVTLYSSLSAVLGGFGYAGYAAANLFMDHFAAAHDRRGAPAWQSVDWDSWHHEELEGARGGLGATLTELAMSPAEGVETLRRLLAIDEPRHLVISTGELAPRIEQWVSLRSLRAAMGGGAGAAAAGRPPAEGLPERVATVWRRVLGIDEVGHEESFFDLGGNSLLAMQMITELNRELEVEVAPVVLFEAPTVAALARHLSPAPPAGRETRAAAGRRRRRRAAGSADVAVIGMSGRFPGAGSVTELWDNLCAGRESIRFFSEDELLEAGVDAEDLCDPDYVRARPVLDGVELFDAGLFGYSPREAEVMDPQHRLFLEAAWEAFDEAGYDTRRYAGRVGVYAGSSISSYLQSLYSDPEVLASVDTFQILLGNEKDSLATKVSYKLDLRGPSLAIQTFCSTSLVAVHAACRALLAGEADMALAGGISIIVPQVSGYRYQEGGIYSRDGHVRAFDARATGMVFGNGVGAVVLKRLEDALADGDQVHAVIKGTAINNDGSLKAGYSAASIEGQSQVVVDALEAAGVDPATVSYVETHGSGTGLGDPVEIAALTRAFGAAADRRRTCAIGSVKTNVGHLDRAAGVTGLIKTVLALRHRKIPPSLHFEEPNPEIDFEHNPFYVNTELADWPAGQGPRRAGVTSLGIGGTNAHAVLEEAPQVPPGDPEPGPQLLVLSARTPAALESSAGRLADDLRGRDGVLADVAFTLQMGRRELPHRRAVVARDPADAAEALGGGASGRAASGVAGDTPGRVAFLFPGQGAQYPGMGSGLYGAVPVYRRELERCAEVLSSHLELGLLELLHPGEGVREEAALRLAETRFTQPALFAVEYALARTWEAWGVRPEGMIGHSVGEYVAACLAGVFSLEDALALVAERGRLIQELPAGEMLSVPLPEEEVAPRLAELGLSLAAVNAPDRVVVSGAAEAVAGLEEALAAEGVEARRLHTSHAFHSPLVEDAVEPFVRRLGEVDLRPPRIPFVSCVTGTWITDEQATEPGYWGEQLRRSVRFSDGLQELLGDRRWALLEVGPGRSLTTLARRHLEAGHDRCLAPSLPGPREGLSDHEAVLDALGRLWTAGFSPDWAAVHGGARRLRVSLPSYPFERRRHWVGASGQAPRARGPEAGRRPEDWLFGPAWRMSSPPRLEAPAAGDGRPWLLLGTGVLTDALAALLAERGRRVSVAPPAAASPEVEGSGNGNGHRPASPDGGGREVERWLDDLPEPPGVVFDLRRLTPSWAPSANGAGWLHDPLELARGLDRRAAAETDLWIVTDGVHDVLGQEPAPLEGAGLPALCRAVTRSSSQVVCRHLDLLGAGTPVRLQAEQIVAEGFAAGSELTVAFRGRRRWVPAVEPAAAPPGDRVLPAGGWLVTGGLSEPGFGLAGALVEGGVRRLALLEPEAPPPRASWDDLAADRPPAPEELDAVLDELRAERALGFDLAGADLPERLARLAASGRRSAVPEEFDALADELCAAHAYRFFAAEADAAPGRSYGATELREAVGVVPRFGRFFDYLLHVLDRAGMAEVGQGRVTFTREAAAAGDPEALGERIKERYPDFAPGIDCVAHCAAHYREVFRGETDPVSVLFPGGSPKLLRAVMETQDRYSVNRVFVPLMAELLREAAACRSDRPLRVLELGAGDGNLTWELAEALRGANVEYSFTDIGRSFVVAARKAAEERGLDFLRFGVLDATREPAGQGFDPFGYDVLVAFDVVHATPEVRTTMANLRRFLAPGGFTLILEPTRDQHWISLIWGLADGWWAYADEDLRTLHPLLEPRRWEEEVLGPLGAAYTAVFPVDPEERATADHSLLVLQQPVDLRDPPYVDEYLELAAERWRERRRREAGRVRRLSWLEDRGAEVEVRAAPDAGALTRAVHDLRDVWGPPAGVIHAAAPWQENGLPGASDELDPEPYARAVAASAAAVAALEAGLDGAVPELAYLVSPWSGAEGEAPGPAGAIDLDLAARASRRGGSVRWRSLVWGLPLAAEGNGGGLPPRLAGRALAAATGLGHLDRVLVTHRPTPEMAVAWNRLPEARTHGAPVLDEAAEGYEAPAGETEEKVAAVWRRVLGVDRVGRHDDFFSLGGDSLITTQVHTHLHRTFGVKVPVEKLFEELTVAGQARLVDAGLAAEEAVTEETILAQLADMSNEEAEAELERLAASGRSE